MEAPIDCGIKGKDVQFAGLSTYWQMLKGVAVACSELLCYASGGESTRVLISTSTISGLEGLAVGSGRGGLSRGTRSRLGGCSLGAPWVGPAWSLPDAPSIRGMPRARQLTNPVCIGD